MNITYNTGEHLTYLVDSDEDFSIDLSINGCHCFIMGNGFDAAVLDRVTVYGSQDYDKCVC